MNSVGLEFILALKDLIYAALAPSRTKADREMTLMPPEFKYLSIEVFQSIEVVVIILVAAVWALSYIYYFQNVLPGYKWDIREICEAWMEERYSITRNATHETYCSTCH